MDLLGAMGRTKSGDRILEAISILQQRAKFPVAVQEKIDESAKEILMAIELFDKKAKSLFDPSVRNGIDDLIHTFLRNVEYSVLHLLCESSRLERNPDTEDAIEFSIRCFPRVLSTKFKSGRSLSTYNAIMLQAQPDFKRGPRDANCISFVPLLARLGNELGQFEKDKRGGLFLRDIWSGNNVLQMLAATNLSYHTLYYSEHHQIVDDLYLDAIKELRAMGFFRKEDIRNNAMLHRMCNHLVLPRKRFLYLVDWDPTTLAQPDTHGRIPLHYWAVTSTILGLGDFRTVLKAGLRHFPMKGIGLLFQKDNKGNTPFQLACKPWPYQLDPTEKRTVKEITDGINHEVDANTFLHACSNKRIHLDGVYFLLRRQPQLLRSTFCHTEKTTDKQEQGHNRAKLCQERETNESKKRKGILLDSSTDEHSKRLRSKLHAKKSLWI
mmetsp:Transcript_16234/g.44948  ORF Transcript_16234/g.44948 Transcript_16234/m.44948 type:complete len:438 (-) Transcript_16234:451-1764(-)